MAAVDLESFAVLTCDLLCGQAEPEAGGSAIAREPDGAATPNPSPAQPVAAIEEINTPPSSDEPGATSDSGAGADEPRHDQDEVIADKATAWRNEDSTASQQQHSQPENLQTLARRSHGRALPK